MTAKRQTKKTSPGPARRPAARVKPAVDDTAPERSANHEKPWLSKRAGEVLGLLLWVLTILVALALFSHHYQDPGVAHFKQLLRFDPVHNLIGPVGALVSDALLMSLGLASLWLILILAVEGVNLLLGRRERTLWRLTGGAGLIVLSAAMIHLVRPRAPLFGYPDPTGLATGGVVGRVVAGWLDQYLSGVGAGLVVAAGLVICVLLIADLSPGAAAGALWRLAARTFRWLAALREKNRLRRDKAKKLEAYLADKQSGLKKGPVIRRPPEETKAKAPPEPRQEAFPFPGSRDYELPPLELLDEPPGGGGPVDERILESNSRQLEAKLADFGVKGEVVEVAPGPVITTYEFMPAPGIKISKVAGLADDLALAMRAVSIRIVAPIPGKAVIGIELPNAERQMVTLKEVLSHPEFEKRRGLLTLGLGQDIIGRPFFAPLGKMPHLLIAGATGTGKSVGLNSILMSLLYRAGPDEVKLVLVDPKRIELSVYHDLPHLLHPVVTSPREANAALKWAVREMERRYELLAEAGVRNIDSYNQVLKKKTAKSAPPPEGDDPESAPPEPLPYVVIVIDELADLMMVASKEVEASLTRLAQMARAAGMHLVLATQRPSVDVITGLIKANFPARVSFKVSSRVDSRTILDGMGAESLLGAGDMLFLAPGQGSLLRLHGAYVSEAEVARVVEFIRQQRTPTYDPSITQVPEGQEAGTGAGDEVDEFYQDAVRIVAESGKASISMLQRRLKVGYNRAARMIEKMEDEGLIGPSDGVKPREVLIGR
jgi:S-DNA-T family DNA segregation ATPase FtsK/SpoIIIE